MVSVTRVLPMAFWHSKTLLCELQLLAQLRGRERFDANQTVHAGHVAASGTKGMRPFRMALGGQLLPILIVT